jgi:hypothetical protein
MTTLNGTLLDMQNKKVVYESPDGGNTVYARAVGETERCKVSESEQWQKALQNIADSRQWEKIRQAAKTDPELAEAMDRVRVLYELTRP